METSQWGWENFAKITSAVRHWNNCWQNGPKLPQLAQKWCSDLRTFSANFFDWKSGSANFFAFRMYACSLVIVGPLWSNWSTCSPWSIKGSDMTSALGLVYNIPYFSDTLWTMSTSRILSLTVSLGLTLPPMITGRCVCLPRDPVSLKLFFTVMLRFQGSLWHSWPLLHRTHHLCFLFVRSLFHPWTFTAWY